MSALWFLAASNAFLMTCFVFLIYSIEHLSGLFMFFNISSSGIDNTFEILLIDSFKNLLTSDNLRISSVSPGVRYYNLGVNERLYERNPRFSSFSINGPIDTPITSPLYWKRHLITGFCFSQSAHLDHL